jgi:hypothetical protein
MSEARARLQSLLVQQQGLLDFLGELPGAEGLWKNHKGRVSNSDFGDFAGIRRHQEDSLPGTAFTYGFGELDATHMRHYHIRQHQTDFSGGLEGAQGLLSGARLENRVPGITKHSGRELTNPGFVIDDHDGDRDLGRARALRFRPEPASGLEPVGAIH